MLLTAFSLLIAAFSASSTPPDEVVTISDTATCIPEIVIYSSSTPFRICLNRFNASPDSCSEVIISGDVLTGVSLHFIRTNTAGWHYAGITQPDSVVSSANLRIEITTNHRGDLHQAVFYPEYHDTLENRLPDIPIRNDLPIQDDTLPGAGLHFQRIVRPCRPPEKPAVVVHRKYTYPPNYRRDPVYNHPELSMFHCGKSVRMPTTPSLENRALQYIYYHCNVLAPLQFDNPEELEKREAVKNRFKKVRSPKPVKKKKKPFLRLRRLH